MDRTERVVGLLAELVAMPTVSNTPNEPLLEWLDERLTALGGDVRVEPGAPGAEGRANLIARLGPAVSGGVVLAGHTDVVPPGDGWTSDPFTLRDAGDRVVARGSADMKGFFAAIVVAAERAAVGELQRPVYVLASYDEEIGCLGARHVLPTLATLPTPRLIVVGEPTMMVPGIAHLGKHGYRIVVRAAEAHSSRAGREPSAISHAARLIAVLDEIMAARRPVMEGELPPYSVNCGTIRGGTQTNVIAAECELAIEVRFDAEHDADEVLAPLWAAVQRSAGELTAVGGGVDVQHTVGYPAMRTDATHEAVRWIERLADGGPLGAATFGTEGGLYAEAVGAPVVICGPGDIADAHRADEFVTRHQLTRCLRLLDALFDSAAE